MSQQTKDLYEFGRFRLDVAECRLLRDGEPVPLKPKVLETLIVLVEHSGHMLDKDELMRRLWPDSFVEEANLAVNILQLRKALGQGANGEQYIETVPKRGYRFVAQVREVSAAPANLIVRERTRSRIVIEEHETSSQDEVEPAIAVKALTFAAPTAPVEAQTTSQVRELSKGSKQLKRRALPALAALVVAAAIAGYFAHARSARTHAAAQPRTLAVLPFRNLKPDAATDFLGLALADATINRLNLVRALSVRPSSYVAKYRNQEIDPRQVAAELNVKTLLNGSFLKDGDDLRVTAQLIDMSAHETLWQGTIDIKYDKLLTVEDRVAQQVINGLQLQLSPAEAKRLQADEPRDPLAYENYLRGRFLISTSNHALALRLLEKSVELDPNYALAWAYLGKAYSVSASQYAGGREYNDRARAAYKRALARNPEELETRVLLANFLTENNRLEESIPLLRGAVEANPNFPFAHWELSYAYRYAGLLDESISEGERALALYPHLTGHLFNSYLYAGQYEKFIQSLPAWEDAYVLFYRGLGYYYLQDTGRAAAAFDRAYDLDPSIITSRLGKALRLGLAGRNRAGIEMLQAIENQSGASDGELIYKLAQGYAVLGDKPAALRLLRRSIEQGFFCYPYFVSDPLLNNLRAEREYATLIAAARARHDELKARYF